MIRISINVAKIDKTALFEGKNGAKYLNLNVMENKAGVDKYGNSHMVTHDIGQDRRKAGERGPILGNGKTVGTVQPSRPQEPAQGKFTPGAGHIPQIPPLDDSEQVPF